MKIQRTTGVTDVTEGACSLPWRAFPVGKHADVMVGSGALTVESVVRGRTTESHLKILLRLYDAISDVAVLYDAENQAKCVVTRRQLLSRLTK